jgi:CheY-like chemotaxis protein
VIGEDVDLVTLPSPDLGRVKADPGQLEQVLMNLAVNARDAMSGGGKLTIETANVDLDENCAQRHVVVRPGAYVMLSVSDTGSGMTPEVQSHLFEPYFTTKEKGKGTGLGLSTVYAIVQQSEGYVWVYSEVNRGTTFRIYLPRVTDAADAPLPARAFGPARGSETILLVEDDKAVRVLIREFLVKNGYGVLEAEHGGDAVAFCERFEGPIHLLVTDVVMPHMSGPELANLLEPLRPDMKVLFLSGYSGSAMLRHGMLESPFAFVQKPFTQEALLGKVREVLDAPPRKS